MRRWIGRPGLTPKAAEASGLTGRAQTAEAATGGWDFAVTPASAAARVATIELGTDWEIPAPARVEPRLRRGLLASLALALVLAGASAPTRPAVTLLGSVPYPVTSTFTIAGNTLLVGERTPQGLTAAAYALPSLRFLWRSVLPGRGDQMAMSVQGDSVLAQVFDGAPLTPALVSLDLHSGQIRWYRPLVQLMSASDTAALVATIANSPDSQRAESIDLQTGVVRWTAAAAQLTAAVDQGGFRVALLDLDGSARILDTRTGQVLASERNVVPQESDLRGQTPVVSLVGSLLLTSYWRQTTGVLEAHDLVTLRPLWSVTLAQPANDVVGCGPVLCIDTWQTEITGVDPATGQIRWRRPGLDSPTLQGGLVLAGVVGKASIQADVGQVVLDPRNGSTRDRLGNWALASTESTRRVLLTRPGLVGPPAFEDRLWLADVTGAAAQLAILGSVADVIVTDCQLTNAYAACVKIHETLAVWRLPR